MRSVPRHDRMAWATLIMIAALLAQFVLGMAANLFVTIPAHHPGASPKNYFVGAGHSVDWAITSGLLPLAAHVILGILLIVTGFVLTVLVRHRSSLSVFRSSHVSALARSLGMRPVVVVWRAGYRGECRCVRVRGLRALVIQGRPAYPKARVVTASECAWHAVAGGRGWLSLFVAQLASSSSAAVRPASAVRRRKLAMASSSSSW